VPTSSRRSGVWGTSTARVALVTAPARGSCARCKRPRRGGRRASVRPERSERQGSFPGGVGLTVDVSSRRCRAGHGRTTPAARAARSTSFQQRRALRSLAMRPFAEIPLESGRRGEDVKRRVDVLTCRAVVPVCVSRRGKIVNISPARPPRRPLPAPLRDRAKVRSRADARAREELGNDSIHGQLRRTRIHDVGRV